MQSCVLSKPASQTQSEKTAHYLKNRYALDNGYYLDENSDLFIKAAYGKDTESVFSIDPVNSTKKVKLTYYQGTGNIGITYQYSDFYQNDYSGKAQLLETAEELRAFIRQQKKEPLLSQQIALQKS